ncbi:MAG: NAD-dependent epimerase/dehydratase family protein [PVC group bacterium]|nr:NAD-dependent epimerase/dehydratase family protein [PVC group bacterium]
MNKECVFITGATGFIGSHIAEKLIEQNIYNIVAIVREDVNYKNTEQLKTKEVILVKGEFHNKKTVLDIFEKFPIAYVIHCAALRGTGAGLQHLYEQVNVKGTQILLEASLEHRIKRFIFCSSVGVLGTIPQKVPADIDTVLAPDNDYHNSKAKAEQTVQEFVKKGLDAVIIRPTITYGKNDNGFSSILIKLIRRRMLVLPSHDTKIHLLDVEKLAEVFSFFLSADIKKSNVFVIADKQSIILSRLADLIYFNFYKKKYPRMLKIPDICFSVANLIFKFIKNEKWSVRMQLLSKDWYYLPTQPDSGNNFEFSDTEKKFTAYLEAITDEK